MPVVTGHHKTRPLVVRFFVAIQDCRDPLGAPSSGAGYTSNVLTGFLSAREWRRCNLGLSRRHPAGERGERFV